MRLLLTLECLSLRLFARAYVRAPSSSLILCERGDRPLLLPSLSQPRQPARAMGSSHEAASASGCDRSLPSPWPRHSLDRALVRTSWSSHGEGEAGLYRKETDRRRRHRYSKNSPNRRLPIDYLDQMSVNYRDHSQPRASGWMCWSYWGSCHIEPKGSRTGNPFGDHVFPGVATAVAYKTKSRGVCGRHLNPGTLSKVAIDGPFEAVLGKTRRTEF